jgi:hypothetical protein
MSIIKVDYGEITGGGTVGFLTIPKIDKIHLYLINGSEMTDVESINNDYFTVSINQTYPANATITYKKSGSILKMGGTGSISTVTANQTETVNVSGGGDVVTLLRLVIS